MSERTVRCPKCAFSFARLVDAADHHAYECPTCEWTKPTRDRRPGNRPADVCGLCDHPIDLTTGDHHIYLGRGWVHGGGRENMPIHMTCSTLADAVVRTGTLWTDGCSCPQAWHRSTGWHMRGCQSEVA